MAHMFPDCVGEVDVVSDAENIKNLLKIPYHKGHVSMMVHRVENTLLLDDFDIYKHLLRTAETEWEWLKKFFYENINSDVVEADKRLYIKNRKRKALEEKSLVSKFLYHSIIDSTPDDCDNGIKSTNDSKAIQGPLLPEPSPSAEVPDPSTFDHKFTRNVIWTFEDIEMLIGTDMPIFGGGTHPCISLRLRDMNKPISVLTGIDYWLDNLMSNVPEVVMCYHLNGIVQKYELVKTEDLPRMDNSKFSPKLIRDVAQSILSFLKSNATKAGHTYWLFKARNEEVVKLYDLTSLCSEKDVDKDQNPFTVPVAMLLYRVARNMKHSPDRHQPGTIRMLLKNCIKLLSQEKYPEIVTSSHYMLSDLYVPARTNPERPGLDQMETDEYEPCFEDDDENEPGTNAREPATKTLNLDSDQYCDKFVNNYRPPPPIIGTLEDRCLTAISHVAAGLNCLKYFSSKDNKNTEDENQTPMANPFEPIPMPYSKINETKESYVQGSSKKNKKKEKNKKKSEKSSDKYEEKPGALLPKGKAEAQPLPTWQNPVEMDNISWKRHLKTLLYEKAVLVYAILAEHYYGSASYGHGLRIMGLLVRCKQIIAKLTQSSSLCDSTILGRAGDCCIMIVQKWTNIESYKEQYNAHSEEDLRLIEQLERDEEYYETPASQSHLQCIMDCNIDSIENTLLAGVKCYEQALKPCETESMLFRLGNVLNEIASFYLNKARQCKSQKETVDLCKKAEGYLKRGLEVFEKAKNDGNTALLYTNMGHLHRLLAYTSTPTERGELTIDEKIHYRKAFVNYKKALQVLGGRSYCPGIWDAVTWELSTALFTMASIMHEQPNSSLSKAEAEREVIEVLQKALQYCDLNEENPKYPLYQYRAAVIHLRLASLYHNSFLSSENDAQHKKTIIQLARLNYEKAAKLFFGSGDVMNYLTSQMQYFALVESLADGASAAHVKIKHFQNCLDILLGLIDFLGLIVDNKVEMNRESLAKEKDSKDDGSYSSYQSLLNLARQRLQYVLRNLTRLFLTKVSSNTEASKLTDTYKACYAATFALKDGLDAYELANTLKTVLSDIKQLLEKHKTNT